MKKRMLNRSKRCKLKSQFIISSRQDIKQKELKNMAELELSDLKTEFAESGEVLVVGWGGTYGSLHSAVQHLSQQGHSDIGYAHFNYINPLPKNTEEVLSKFNKILVCELNDGQFANILRMNFNTLTIILIRFHSTSMKLYFSLRKMNHFKIECEI